MLVAASDVVQTAVVLDMGSDGRLFAEVELARDLGIGAAQELAAEVEVDEIVPRAPVVGLKLLEGDGDFLTVGLLVGIDITAEIVV